MDSLFHDEEIDGPLPQRLRVLALTLAAERQLVSARVAGFADVDVIGVQDVPNDLADSGDTGVRHRSDGRLWPRHDRNNNWPCSVFDWRWPGYTYGWHGARRARGVRPMTSDRGLE